MGHEDWLANLRRMHRNAEGLIHELTKRADACDRENATLRRRRAVLQRQLRAHPEPWIPVNRLHARPGEVRMIQCVFTWLAQFLRRDGSGEKKILAEWTREFLIC